MAGSTFQTNPYDLNKLLDDCHRGIIQLPDFQCSWVPVKESSLEAFDFLIVTFLNIGKFFGKNDGATGAKEPEFYTLSRDFIREHHDAASSWQKVKLRKLEAEIEPFKNDAGFELIAKALGVTRPRKFRNRSVDAEPAGARSG